MLNKNEKHFSGVQNVPKLSKTCFPGWVKAWFQAAAHFLLHLPLQVKLSASSSKRNRRKQSIRVMKLSARTPPLIPENERLLEEHPSCVQSRFYWGRSWAVNQSYRATDVVKRPVNDINLLLSDFLKEQFVSKWMFTHQEEQPPGCKFYCSLCFLKTEKHYSDIRFPSFVTVITSDAWF